MLGVLLQRGLDHRTMVGLHRAKAKAKAKAKARAKAKAKARQRQGVLARLHQLDNLQLVGGCQDLYHVRAAQANLTRVQVLNHVRHGVGRRADRHLKVNAGLRALLELAAEHAAEGTVKAESGRAAAKARKHKQESDRATAKQAQQCNANLCFSPPSVPVCT